jgi:hypothetical protein
MSIVPTIRNDGKGTREKEGKGIKRHKVCERLLYFDLCYDTFSIAASNDWLILDWKGF